MVAAEILEEKKRKEEEDLMFDDIGAETGQVQSTEIDPCWSDLALDNLII